MKVIGVLLLIGAAVFGVITLSEFSRYQSLVADGNPFGGLVSNSYGLRGTSTQCGPNRRRPSQGPCQSPNHRRTLLASARRPR
jgi:hypothetical protein